ncbi:hypothetical protein ACIQMR_14345 [Streptomyces sp. NPDC091376]|uniref:hypothetical protein n=1 Tax=Streptomyces sp. NPDC091376 TaxID=3365994 RepID=UPI0037F552B9
MVPSEAERLREAHERAHEAGRVLTGAELAEAVRTAGRAAEILADREQVRQRYGAASGAHLVTLVRSGAAFDDGVLVQPKAPAVWTGRNRVVVAVPRML